MCAHRHTHRQDTHIHRDTHIHTRVFLCTMLLYKVYFLLRITVKKMESLEMNSVHISNVHIWKLHWPDSGP